ncbi:MAG TPA: prepilin-type N-terminal cleavage/methylation domain-containing protein [Deltaproteobacteria bacterium]|nr:prepilin-type N-terminal cleavage/methylation domain-containing protein [Deltaproteobacteria bacterium]
MKVEGFFKQAKETGDIFNTRGFTLLEILIAIFILGVVMSTVYASYSTTLSITHDVDYESRIYKMARISLDRMIKDLTSLQKSGDAFFLRAQKARIDRRDFDSISFWSASHLDFGENAVTQRPASIYYYARQNRGEETVSLVRADIPGAVPLLDKREPAGFVICENIDYYRLTFYETGDRETDSWDSLSDYGGQKGKIPAAIKIELGLKNEKDEERPYRFMTMIYLPAKE